MASQIVPFRSSSSSSGSSSKEDKHLLHGNLQIWVYEASNMAEAFCKNVTYRLGKRMGKRLPDKVTDKFKNHVIGKITSGPYVTIAVGNVVVGKTNIINDRNNPVWMQQFNLPVAHYASKVSFQVKDKEFVGAPTRGTLSIPAEKILTGTKVEGSFPILTSTGKPCSPDAELRISIHYIPVDKSNHIVESGVGVPRTYFPLRKGGEVKLYQDAHVPDGSLPDVKLGNGATYENGQCWYDICNAISQASRLIYITGWSVNHLVRLVRDGANSSNVTLGELLKSKSQDGVRVLLLVWDDPLSNHILGFKMHGFVQTGDEVLRSFFKQSSVQVLLTPRSSGKQHHAIKKQETGTIYTHHQKTIMVDVDAGNGNRKIISFLGGLDLCEGRYDNPQHPIFRTLQTHHKDDFYNPMFKEPDAGCPRQPWHDLHCKIDGPAAYDVLTNFEERWRKASKRHGFRKLKKSDDDALLNLDRISDISKSGMTEAEFSNENNLDTWHVQVFRSIDSNSAKGFPKDPTKATIKNLVCGKNERVDTSIHTAYVNAIRSAQHFIYIENQYFLGSSYNWTQNNEIGGNNLIPMEIALKIASKIRERKRFAAYIVVPMWPEGNPPDVAMQTILFYQRKTMEMMYGIIYKALEEVGLAESLVPQDFLNFFCLGNREALDSPSEGSSNALDTQVRAKKNRRFMIYVHSKGMIVDDEYVIIGSANINYRSMEGTRDTEIAMGTYQPHHTWAKNLNSPHGKVYGYRMSLWAEHIGALEECFMEPESLECVRRVRSLGEANWRQFAADEVTEMTSHLLKYPVEVDRRGEVTALLGSETFPDVGGKVIGTYLGIAKTSKKASLRATLGSFSGIPNKIMG
ncbi:phospholipase D [Ranunculus cassubicifolius]